MNAQRHLPDRGAACRLPSGRAPSVLALVGALAVVGVLAYGAPAPAYAESSRRPLQQPTTSSTATPRLIVWTATPAPGAQTATAAALYTEIAVGVATAIALTAQAATPVATAEASAQPGGGQPQPGGGRLPPPGMTPGSGTPGEGAATPAGTADPAGPETSGSSPGGGGGSGGDGGGSGGNGGDAGVRAGVDQFGMRKAAPWLPAVQDGVIGPLWARSGPPSEESSIWRRLTGVSAGTRRPGPFGWVGTYVLLALLLVGCVVWLLAEARLRSGGVERKRRRRRPAAPPSPWQ